MDAQALVTRIIRDARIPQGNSYREPATLLSMADDATETEIVPKLIRVAGRYLAASADVPLVAGKSRYRLPVRAVRGEYVQRLDSSGKVQEGFTHAQLPDVAHLEGTTGTPRFWYFEASSVVVRPVPVESGGFLRLTYVRRPSTLVLPSAAYGVWTVTGYNAGTGVLQVSGPQIPAMGEPVDVVRATPGHEALVDDEQVATSSGAGGLWDVTLSAPLSEVPDNGDFLALKGTSPVPQLPPAYHAVLAQAVVAKVLKEMRQDAAHAAAEVKLAAMLADALEAVAPRTRESRVVVNRTW